MFKGMGSTAQSSGPRVQGSGFRSSGFRVPGAYLDTVGLEQISGDLLHILWPRRSEEHRLALLQGSGLRVQGLGFRV